MDTPQQLPPELPDLSALAPEDFGEPLARLMPSALPIPSAPPAMPSSPTVHRIAGALAKAQGDFPSIPRDRTVTVRMRDKPGGGGGGSYTFTYAPLSTIREKTRPALAAAELAILQAIIAEPTEGGGVVEVLRTTLLHSSGEWLACDVPMFSGTGDNKAQAYNSGATYARRLGVTLLLCIAADEDDDGNGGEQDRPTPDYERQEQTAYRGSFPRQGGGRSQQRGGGQGNRSQGHPDAPRTPQRRQDAQPQQRAQQGSQAQREPLGVDYGGDDGQAPFRDDPLPDFGLEQFKGDAVDGSTGEVVSPWGADLTAGEVRMAKARAEVAGLDDAGVLKLCGPVTQANISDALGKLKTAADRAIQD